MRFLPLIAATYFMVSGGPYGIEDILGGAGFLKAIVILLLLPFLWSLPTALMIGELASAIPAEGGFYVWVRRALGPFWGYQEGWLSLSASIFDMAIYPGHLCSLPGQVLPRAHRRLAAATRGRWRWWCSAARGTCAARPPWATARCGLFVLLLAPFAVFVVLGFWHGLHAASRGAVGAAGLGAGGALDRGPGGACGTTWAGTTPPPWRRRSRIRSATIRAP